MKILFCPNLIRLHNPCFTYKLTKRPLQKYLELGTRAEINFKTMEKNSLVEISSVHVEADELINSSFDSQYTI